MIRLSIVFLFHKKLSVYNRQIVKILLMRSNRIKSNLMNCLGKDRQGRKKVIPGHVGITFNGIVG